MPAHKLVIVQYSTNDFYVLYGQEHFFSAKNKKYQIETKRYVIKFETIVYITLTFIVFTFCLSFKSNNE